MKVTHKIGQQSKSKRRQFLGLLSLSSIGLGGMLLSKSQQDGLPGLSQAHAHHTDTHFDDESKHKLVYQLNKAEHDYIDHVLFSCGEMLRKYNDDIELVVTAFGPGLNLLVKQPKRAISPLHQERVKSLIDYGVRFQACGNTMKTMKWVEKDIIDDVQIVQIGIDGIMKLQEQGFSYISI